MSKTYKFHPENKVFTIGDEIIYNNLKFTLTKDVIDNNPEIFTEIEEKLFRTINGTNIYPDYRYYYVEYDYLRINSVIIDKYNYTYYKNTYLFKTLEEAEKDLYNYITSNAEDYSLTDNISIHKFLMVISKHLNGEWKPTEHNDKFIIMSDFTVDKITDLALIDVVFKSKSTADRAVDIIKLFLFKLKKLS
jgi:hypothetical protein